MADVKRATRPLSPHLSIYRWQLGSAMSIFHRFTGLGLGLSGILVVWWFLGAAIGADYFYMVDGLLTSWIGGLILIVSLAALWYHFCNGIRHLVWDTGTAMDLENVRKGGIAVLAAAGVMTIFTLVVAY